jgi:predicted RNA-binding protein with PUA-like domain
MASIMSARQSVQYWLMKSEPDTFSIDDLQRDKTAPWEGVRNYQARNNMRSMNIGDLVLFYHSSCKVPAVVGLARVCREAYPDPTAFDRDSPYYDDKTHENQPRWYMVDVEFIEKLPKPVTLEDLKCDAFFHEMMVVSRGRLSVQPVRADHFRRILELGQARVPWNEAC